MLKYFRRLFRSICDLLLFWGKKHKFTYVLAFYMESVGEFQFFEPTLSRLLEQEEILFLVVHPGLGNWHGLQEKNKKILFVDEFILSIIKRKISIFLNTEFKGLKGVYSICLFHGQPSKGVTFARYKIWEQFDAFFMYGPLHRQAYEEIVLEKNGVIPSVPEVFKIGYPKSDDLINGKYDRRRFLLDLNLDPDRPTVIYAPAFNEGASLRCYGPRIIDTLCQLPYSVIVKLPIDCLQPVDNFYATGGLDWFQALTWFQARYINFRLMHELKIDAALAAADVLITCISSVGFEFMAIGKPVVFINTPKYFSNYLKKLFPNQDVEALAQRNTVNGGKEWGVVVDHPQELPQAVSYALRYPGFFASQNLRTRLLYNPGNAAKTAADTVLSILFTKIRPQ